MKETKLRIARAEDAESFVTIKHQLPFINVNGDTTTGGFLLGADLETYRHFILNDHCLVVEDQGQVVGFGIVLKDATVKQSDLWLRRTQASWEIDIDAYAQRPIAYFEQLAFLKGYGRDVLRLCHNCLTWAFESGHRHMFATTVKEPVTNLAAVPFILRGGGKWVGNIDETYPLVGHIKSDIYKIDADDYLVRVQELPFFHFLAQNTLSFELK
jgi:hypothetical protein